MSRTTRNLKSIIKQMKLNFWYVSKRAFVWTSSSIALFQLVAFLCELNDIFPDDYGFFKRLMISAAVVIFTWIMMFIVRFTLLMKEERVPIINADNGHRVYVEYGDLFQDNGEQKNIVVTANRCFDTIVDDDLISSNTIHGRAVTKICTGGYTADMLNVALQKDLTERRQIKPNRVLSNANKPVGNLQRYPAGSIAEFKKSPDAKTTYFFVGMSAFNSSLHPETTDKEYVVTVQSLIEYCNLRSQQFPVYMPIIGTHGRINKKSERELLEYMVSAFRINKHLINTDIHIVVYSERRDEVSIYGL